MDDGTLGWRDAVALVVSTGVPAIVGLAAWEGLSAWLADPAYRKALWLPADLFTLAAEVLSVALLPPLALAAAGMLARGGVAIATARARLAGLAGTLAAAVFAAGMLASRAPGRSSPDLDAGIALVVAVSVGWAAARLARVAVLREAVARLVRIVTAAVIVIVIALSLARAIAGGASAARAGAHGAAPNVILIVADSLRADHVSAYGAGRARTPQIDALAARGARFEIAYAASSNTPQSLAALLTGHSAPGSGASLASAFAAAGYATHAVTADASLEGSGELARGFATWTGDLASSQLARHASSRLAVTLAAMGLWRPPEAPPSAALVVDEALARADASGPPFFLLLHMMDASDPYTPAPNVARGEGGGDPPAPMRARELAEMMEGRHRAEPQDLERLRSLYAGSVTSIDAEIGRLVRGLESRGLSDRTIVAVTSDHGEEFIEHGGLGHDDTLYEELVRVPLVIAGPAVTPGLVLKGPVRAIDVAPTLAEAAAVKPDGPFDGASAWGAIARGEPLTQRQVLLEMTYVGARHPFHLFRSVRSGDEKVIGSTFHVDGAGPWRWELYDLSADPLEKHDLAAARPGILMEVRSMGERERAK